MEEHQNEEKLDAWQQRLLPIMVRMVVGLTLFFFLATLFQLVYLHINIKDGPAQIQVATQSETTIDFNTQQNFILEAYVIDKRYHQANVLLMSRVWTRYLGFVTGMILAMVGAVFILGRLQSPQTKLKADAADSFRLSISSASPGIILVALGVTLMAVTIVTHHEIGVVDARLFTGKNIAPKTELVGPD